MKPEFVPERRTVIVDPSTGRTRTRIEAPYHPERRAANLVAMMRELARDERYSAEERKVWTRRAADEATALALRVDAKRRAGVAQAPALPRPQVRRAPRRAIRRPAAKLSANDGPPPGPPQANGALAPLLRPGRAA